MLDERNAPNASFSRRSFVASGLAAAAALGAAPLAATAAPDYNRIAKLIGVDPKYAGKGLSLDIGMVFPLTGSGAVFGNRLTDLPKMALRHIEAMGGPKFNIVLKDNVSGLATAGVQAVRELGFAKVPMEITSYGADLGAMNPGIAQYKIFSLDGTGGTSLFAQNKPYFWGAIAITPDDAIPGIAKYIKAKMPQVKRVGLVGWDLGDVSIQIVKDIKRLFGGEVQFVAQELVLIGETDFSSPLQKLKSVNPDLVLAPIYAEDQGYFLKQYATSGINKPVISFASTSAAAAIAGSAFNNVIFAFDNFYPDRQLNPFAKFFVDEFKALEHVNPDYYAANFYEEIFILWDCVRRVLKKGGNPKDGTQLDAALRANPVFPSLYGGDANKPGTISFDLRTHSVKSRPMSISRYSNGTYTPLAEFNIGGSNFRTL